MDAERGYGGGARFEWTLRGGGYGGGARFEWTLRVVELEKWHGRRLRRGSEV